MLCIPIWPFAIVVENDYFHKTTVSLTYPTGLTASSYLFFPYRCKRVSYKQQHNMNQHQKQQVEIKQSPLGRIHDQKKKKSSSMFRKESKAR